MKIAYIFHGHSRTWKLCCDNFFENVFSILPGDIFIHTWDRVNTECGSHWNGWADLSGEKLQISQQLPDITGIYKKYCPKIMIVEKDEAPNISNYNNSNIMTRASLGTKNMLRGSRKIFEIANQYDNYDKFFSTRLDMNYLTKLNLEEIDTQDMLTSYSNDYVCDMWMVGNKDQMNIKTNYVNYIDKYWFNKENFTSIMYESAFGSYMKDMNIKFKNSNLKFEIKRLF